MTHSDLPNSIVLEESWFAIGNIPFTRWRKMMKIDYSRRRLGHANASCKWENVIEMIPP